MSETLAPIVEAANAALVGAGGGPALESFFAPGYVAHTTGRDLPGGPAAARAFADALGRAFSELEVTVDVLLEAGDRVAWQRTLTGIHTGAFMGFPPTGRRITWRDMFTSRIRGGQFEEDWAVSDLAEQLLRARKRKQAQPAR